MMSISNEPFVVGPDLRLRVLTQAEDHWHIECAGDVGLPAFMASKEPLAEWLGPSIYAQRMLLSFENVQFLDSSGISWLIMLHKRFSTAKGILVLHSIPPLAQEVIQLLQLDRVLNIQSDLPSARKFLEEAKQ